MVVRAGAVGAAVAARRWDFAGALEQAADTAAARARTNSRSAIAVTLISQPSDAPVYLIVYAPTATVSEVAVRRPPPVDGQDLAGDERRRRRGKNTATSPISSGVPMRPMGVRRASLSASRMPRAESMVMNSVCT